MKTNAHIIKVPIDGNELPPRVRAACQQQTLLDSPRKLVSTFVLQTAAGEYSLFLVFELFDQS